MGKFLTKGAQLKCSMGSKPGSLNVSGNVLACSNPMANELDALPIINIPSFGLCKVTKTPCIPATCCWNTNLKTLVRDFPAVDDGGKVTCALGGTIQATDAGQESVQN